jgi:hypothetical protein
MRLATTPVIFVATAALLGAAPQRSTDLLGRWKGAIEENGVTTEVSIDFFPSGTYARRVTLISEFGWTQSGDVLLIAPALEKRDNEISYGKASVVSMKLADDVLVIADAKQSISMKRATAPVNESALVGRWEGQSELNEGITQDFLSDGRLIVTTTLAREAGRYLVRDQDINWEIQIPNPHKSKSKFRLEKNKLTLFLSSALPALEMTRVAPEIVAR